MPGWQGKEALLPQLSRASSSPSWFKCSFKGRSKLPRVLTPDELTPTPLQGWAERSFSREGEGDTVSAVSLTLSLLPGESCSSAGSRAAAERQEHASIACNQATVRTELRGEEEEEEEEASLQALADGSVCVRVGRGHGILRAWEGPGTGLPAPGTPLPTFCCLTRHLPPSPFRNGGGNKGGKKIRKKHNGGSQTASFCMSCRVCIQILIQQTLYF